jgi:hypothetical protein
MPRCGKAILGSAANRAGYILPLPHHLLPHHLISSLVTRPSLLFSPFMPHHLITYLRSSHRISCPPVTLIACPVM